MSTAYYVHCVTCHGDDSAEFSNPHAAHERITLIPVMLALQAMTLEYGVEITHADRHVSLAWYREHQTHALRIRDEYGRFHTLNMLTFACADDPNA
jgi:hypothetical protein